MVRVQFRVRFMKLHNPLQQVIYAAGKINMPFKTKNILKVNAMEGHN